MKFIFSIVLFPVALLGYMWKSAFENRIVYHTFRFPQFPACEKLRLFFISDVHKRKIDDKLIEKMKDEVDAVIIGGDLTEEEVPFLQVAENVKKLKSLAPVYFVWGNNDYEAGEDELSELLEENGVTVLRNESKSYLLKEHSIDFIGVEDVSKRKADLEKAVQGAKAPFRLLLSHNPFIMRSIKEEMNISLILSGHTHGGQIRFFGWGPYEHGGVYTRNGTTILISNGYGTTKVPLRLGAKPQTHHITITS
ncbi:metallophosphoesterase [Priestia endophytica]|uniref:metallophosphoesterase n=1 Tax=Priestia endophytica TaxID=135735 RepID=UPI003D2AEBE1